MRRLLQPFVLVVTALLAVTYTYVAARISPDYAWRLALAIPFVLVWIVPAFYWTSERDDETRLDDLAHQASYLSMAWVSFLFAFTVVRDLALIVTALPPLAHLHGALDRAGLPMVLGGSLVA